MRPVCANLRVAGDLATGRTAVEQFALEIVESILDVGVAMGIAEAKRPAVKGILAIARAEEAILRQSSIEQQRRRVRR